LTLEIARPHWIQIAFRRTISLFMTALARSHSWRRIYIVSPWISEFGTEAGMSFSQMLKRVVDEDVVLYVVTRTPKAPWHQSAVEQIAATKKSNVVLLDDLHTKLFAAELLPRRVAMFGSANLTSKSLTNRELGVLVSGDGEGGVLVDRLIREATEVYRSPNRNLIAQRQFSRGRRLR
jgi:hypothetical protein